MAEPDIFISYRRIGAAEFAIELYTQLKMRGYSVFLDMEENWTGDYRERLPEYVRNCTDFILILPPSGMGRCAQEDDMVRIEIATALAHRKNIIPLHLHGFEIPQDLPEDITGIANQNAILTYGKSFKESLQLIISRLDSQRMASERPVWAQIVRWLLSNVYLWRIIFFPILALIVSCLCCLAIPPDFFTSHNDLLNYVHCLISFTSTASLLIGCILWCIHRKVEKTSVRFLLYPLAILTGYILPAPLVYQTIWNHQYNLCRLPLNLPLLSIPIMVTFASLICTLLVQFVCMFFNSLLEAAYR